MPSPFGSPLRRNWPFVGFVAFACAAWPFARALRADEVKATAALPRPVVKIDEERAYRSLAKPTTVQFRDLPLEDCITFLMAYHNIDIRVDRAALAKATIPVDSPVTLILDQAPFQRTLNLLLAPRGLDSLIEGSGLMVTTRAAIADAVRGRLEKLLEPELQIIDHLCELTDAQREKLRIAGRGDIRRLTEGIAERAMKLPLVGSDEKKVDELCREIEELQRQIKTGPFGNGSLVRKTVETTLTPSQNGKYDPIRTVLQAGGLVGTIQRGPDVILGVLLRGATFADNDLARLAGLTALGFLVLEGTEVTDAGLAYLKDLTNLRELDIGDTRVTDAGLVNLKELKNLRVLKLRGTTAVTDAGLAHLKGLTALQVLELTGTKASAVGIAELRLALPNVEVED
jgi:hypothetical protein